MTREEAIKILNRDDDSMRKGYFCINDFEAIEVLKSVEHCEDYVSRAEALEALNSINGTSELDKAFELIEKLPSVTPKGVTVTEFADRCRECGKQKKGKWIRITQGRIGEIYMCSKCGRTIEEQGIESLVSVRYPYCHCGAEMESGK